MTSCHSYPGAKLLKVLHYFVVLDISKLLPATGFKCSCKCIKMSCTSMIEVPSGLKKMSMQSFVFSVRCYMELWFIIPSLKKEKLALTLICAAGIFVLTLQLIRCQISWEKKRMKTDEICDLYPKYLTVKGWALLYALLLIFEYFPQAFQMLSKISKDTTVSRHFLIFLQNFSWQHFHHCVSLLPASSPWKNCADWRRYTPVSPLLCSETSSGLRSVKPPTASAGERCWLSLSLAIEPCYTMQCRRWRCYYLSSVHHF